MAYQDRWIAGQTTKAGDRACAERYDLIRSAIAPYTRQITVWDLGANLGYFGCRLAHEFGAVSVMVDSRTALVESCRANTIPTTIAMTHRMTADDLVELASSEHVDVVLALNLLHHMEDWRRALAAIIELGETCVVETPAVGDAGSAHYDRVESIVDALECQYGAEPIGQAASHVTPGVMRTIYRVRTPKTSLTKGYAYVEKVRARGAHEPRTHVIASTLTDKTITYDDGESRPWQHGMNLWNWLQLGGSYPDRATVQQSARAAAERLGVAHGDFKPWNLILQGKTVQAIDSGHRYSVDDAEGLAQTLAWIDRPELAYVR